MSPILGIWASQISGHLWAPEGAYDALATVTLSTNTASIVFSGIPADYKHLQLRYIGRTNSTESATNLDVEIYFNTDTSQSSNYRQHRLIGTGAVAVSDTYSNYITPGRATTAAALTNNFAAGVCDILDYTNVNKYKVIRALSGIDNNNTTGAIFLNSGLWQNTAAISTITIKQAANSFVANSQFALYGVK